MTPISTENFEVLRRQRCWELIRLHGLKVYLAELAMTDMLERAVTLELLVKLVGERTAQR